MTARAEYELHCDGLPGAGPFDCPTRVFFGRTAAEAREAAAFAGWVSGPRDGKIIDLCPDHRDGYSRYKLPRGICPVCGQQKALTKLGDVLAKHSNPQQRGRRWAEWCSGSHQPPVTPEATHA